MIKAVIFDLNGVFLESEWLSVRFERKYHTPETEFVEALKRIMNVVRKPDAPTAYSLWKPHLDKWGINLKEDEFFKFWFSGEKLVKELVEYVDEFKSKDILVFILSNNFRERTRFYRNHFPQLFEKLDGAYFSWETGYVKPDKKAFTKIFTDNHLKPQECIYFDDSDKNVKTANSLGIHAFKYEGLTNTKKIIHKYLDK